ncbi:MAG: DUF2752 domain-containing protein [Planctomycetes bacterium]|nr:DUF2752 domain-containing protein [Planctomycetota bacterium]
MTAPDTSTRRAAWTIPLAEGPVSAVVDRVAAAIAAASVGTVVVLLAGVRPDARGHGTHEQLGLEACGWPSAYGIPCPTCGVTTAACHLVHGHVVSAFVVQPFGAVLMLLALAVGAHAAWCLLRGRSFADLLVRLPVWRWLGGLFVLLLLSWGYRCLDFTP